MKVYSVTEEMMTRIIDVLGNHWFKENDHNNDDVIDLQNDLEQLVEEQGGRIGV